ncbi:MAG: hypothetical protein ACI915_005612 [Gammaproteobacteria bacterium]|jgi:hypothetical protein
MSTLKILLAIAFFGSVAALVRLIMRSRKAHKRLSEELDSSHIELSADSVSGQTTDKLSATANLPHFVEKAGHETSDDLSQSGAVSIRHEITRCVASKKWDEALQWASHAVQALPDHADFNVSLAEIYALMEDRDKFIPLFAKLYVDLDDNKTQQARLLEIATKFVPDHPLVLASSRDAAASVTPD